MEHMIGIDNFATGVMGSPNLVADARDLSFFSDRTMDFVYSSHLLEDFADALVPVLKEWVRVVRRGGYVILHLPHPDHYPKPGEPGANPAHKSPVYPDDVQNAMKEIDPDWDLVLNQVRTAGLEYSFLQVYRLTVPVEGAAQEHRESWKDPAPDKTVGIMRPGGYGDTLWASSIIAGLKAEGFHVTLFTEPKGEDVMKADPNVDRIIAIDDMTCPIATLLPFCLYWSTKFTRWVNLIGVVESRLLPVATDIGFHWSKDVRHREMDLNYLDEYHRFSGTEGAERRVRYYATEDEIAWARDVRSKLPGPLVVIQPSGSSAPKFWPYSGELMNALAAEGICSILIGDLRGRTYEAPEGMGMVFASTLPIRQALALCLVADVVVGVESVAVNAVAFEPNLKIVVLGHSSIDNLTRSWRNTLSLVPGGLDCYPCHRIHHTPMFCRAHPDAALSTSACHGMAGADVIVEQIRRYVQTKARATGSPELDAAVAQVQGKKPVDKIIAPNFLPPSMTGEKATGPGSSPWP
jgi:ADP-heptose:LPS heptosyltransferase